MACLYLATKLNETPVRLRDLINTYMYLQARIRFLLAKPADTSLVELSLAGQRRGDDDPLWAGFKFDVPSFHSTVFWECKLFACDGADRQGRKRSSTTSFRR